MHRGAVGVQLFAGGEGSNPPLIRWRASFSNLQAQGVPLTLRDVVFDAIPDGEVDLTAVAPLATKPEPIVRGPQGTSIAELTVEGGDLIVWGKSEAGVSKLSVVSLSELTSEAARKAAADAAAGVDAAVRASRDAAASSASAAKTSEEKARDSEAKAAGSAAAAKTSEQAAKGSESKAAGSAAAAKISETNANMVVDHVVESATAAKTSEAIAKESEANAAGSAATARTQADRSKVEADRSKTEADRAAQAAAESSVKAVNDRVNTLLAGAPEAYDTLLEIARELERGQTAEAALTRAIATKADKQHTHTFDQIVEPPDDGFEQRTLTQLFQEFSIILQHLSDTTAPTSHTHTMSQVTDLPTVSQSAAGSSLAQRDSAGRLTVSAPTSAAHATTKSYVDGAVSGLVVVGNTSATDGNLHIVYE